MDIDESGVTPTTDDWPERRLAAAWRLGRLIRRLGRDAVDSPETLAAELDGALKSCPAERHVLADALKLRATHEINRLRGNENPNAYLPAIAEALANQTGHPRDLASWAVHTWHDVLAAPLPPKFTETVAPPGPPAATGSLASAFVVGVCVFAAAGMVEALLLRGYGPTVVESAIVERTWPKRDGMPVTDRDRRPTTGARLTALAPVGFVLAGGVAGLAAGCAWVLGGGTSDKLSRGGGGAALAGAAATGVLNLIAIHSKGGLALAPPVESLAILGLTGVVTFVASYAIATRVPPETGPSNENDQPNGDDPIQFGSWTNE